MATQNYTWPSVSVMASSPSTGLNGAVSPTSSTLVAGQNPTGFQQPLKTNVAGDLLIRPLTSADSVTVVQPTGSNLHTVVDSSALPTGAATAAKQDAQTVDLDFIVTSSQQSANNTAALNQSPGATTAGKTGPMVLGAVTAAAPTYAATQLHPFSLSTAGSLRTEVTSSALATGASTSALQTTGNTSLASIDSKVPALGQALAAASTPVVLTAAQLTTLTPLTSVTVTQASGANLHVNVDASALPTNAASETSLVKLTLSPGATIGSNTGAIVLGVANSTTPTYTANQMQPFGLTLSGDLKTSAKTATPPALTITNTALTVGTTAVRLTVSGAAPSANRVVLVVTPDAASTAKFYIGSNTVTSTGLTRGAQIQAGQVFVANNDAGDYYIVSDTAAQTVEIMEQG